MADWDVWKKLIRSLTLAEVDFDLLKRQIDERVVIYSEGDDRVQPDFSLEQAESLDAIVVCAEHQGHFH
jgi:hypothetical protein